MGGKTQVATGDAGCAIPEFVLVILGTTVGMLLANVPVVLVSHFAADRLPLTLIRRVAASGFAALAVYAAYQAVTMSTIVGLIRSANLRADGLIECYRSAPPARRPAACQRMDARNESATISI